MAASTFGQPREQAVDPLLADCRIALRFGSGHVLIIGGEIVGPYQGNGILDDSSLKKSPQSLTHAKLQPGEAIYLVQPEQIAKFKFRPATIFQIGDRWKLYVGAGGPATVVIRQLAVVLMCGGIGGYAAAIADFESPRSAEIINGLRATEYLAAPGQGVAAVSRMPLIPADAASEPERTGALATLLLTRARATVQGENWEVAPNSDNTEAARIRRMNRRFLADPAPEPQIRYSRWAPPGRTPILFVEALWLDDSGLPLFACEAIVEEGKELKLLSFDAPEARFMRMGEFDLRRWKQLAAQSAFLNAWRIGKRDFVLGLTSGYEGFSVELREVVPGKSLVPAGPGFGAGC